MADYEKGRQLLHNRSSVVTWQISPFSQPRIIGSLPILGGGWGLRWEKLLWRQDDYGHFAV